MKLKRTAILTLLFLLLQQAGSLYAALSPIAQVRSAGEIPSATTIKQVVNSSQHRPDISHQTLHPNTLDSNTLHHGKSAHQSAEQSDVSVMHQDHGQHSSDCKCCGVLGCFAAVNISGMPAVTGPAMTLSQSYLSLYSGKIPSRLYRPPAML